MRGLSIIFGIIAIVGALVVLADPALGIGLLILFLSVGLLFMGIDRLITGISGQTRVMGIARKSEPRQEGQNTSP